MPTTRTSTAARLLELGSAAEAAADYPRAEGHSRRAVGAAVRDPVLRLRAAAGVARMHRVQGRYAPAEQLYRRTLARAEETRGRHSLEVAGLLNELAILYKYAGRFA